MAVYNKLVRDNIPDIMLEKGVTPVTRILDEEEYMIELNKKLLEEVNEYLESGEVLELADIEEVLLAILDYKKVSTKEFDNIRKTKALKRGAFKNRIFLESDE